VVEEFLARQTAPRGDWCVVAGYLAGRIEAALDLAADDADAVARVREILADFVRTS
jgi:hypothetical protein